MDDANNLYKIFEVFGTPGVVGVFLIWLGRWAKPLAEKVVARHIEFVDEIKETQVQLCTKLDQSVSQQGLIVSKLDALNGSVVAAVKKI